MKLRYTLMTVNVGVVLIAGYFTWPLPLDRFTAMKYIEPILLLNFQDFVRVMNRIRIMLSLDFDMETFVTVTTVAHYMLVIAVGAIQWFTLGLFCERIVIILKSRRPALSR